MLKVKNRDNLYIDGMDPWEMSVSPQKLALLKKSWAEIFRQHILAQMPVRQIAKHFSKTQGRPSKELVSTCAACVLQQIFDLTDVETRDQLAFNQQWHYALDVLEQQDQVLSFKTLWNMRNILITDKSAKNIFNDTVDRLKEVYKVDTSLQRLDSVHIHSNMARLGRVRLLARVCTKFLLNLKRHYKEQYESVPDSLKSRYEKENDSAYFGNSKPSESQKRLADIAQDIYELVESFKGDNAICSLYSYKDLQRVFGEHCLIEDNLIKVKPSSEIPVDSLQNPSDRDVTYDGHKGQGYQVQLMEIFSRKPPEDNKADSLELITYIDVEPAHEYDGNALKPALDQTQQRDILPDELQADSHYGSRENKKKAKERGVNLIAPVPGKTPKNNLVNFDFDPKTHEVKRCPKGHAPTRVKRNKKGTLTAIWPKEICGTCPLFPSCSVRKAKSDYRLLYNHNQADAALHRRYEQSDEFKDKYRYRAGIEATNSRYIHMTGARRIRYRGLNVLTMLPGSKR